MVLSATQLWTFVPAAALLAASPGANNLLALRNGIRSGMRPAAIALLGRLSAFAIMLALVVAGLAVVLNRSQQVFEVLKWAGAGYLIALGVRTLWITHPRRWVRAHPAGATERSAVGTEKLTVQEFTTAAANPKALLLFTAFLPQFTSIGHGNISAQLALLGVLYISIETLTAIGWAAVGRWIGVRAVSRNTMRRIDRASGLVFVGLGGSLAAESTLSGKSVKSDAYSVGGQVTRWISSPL